MLVKWLRKYMILVFEHMVWGAEYSVLFKYVKLLQVKNCNCAYDDVNQ